MMGRMNTDLSPSGRLPHVGLLRFAGPDAIAFLQGQISNDARRLSGGSPLLAAYSSPQGRVAAVLHLLPHASGIIALLPREIVLPTLERLRKYVLRAKVKIEDVSDQFVVAGVHDAAGLIAAGLPVPESALGYVERAGIGVGSVTASPGRYWVIGSGADLAKHGIPDTGPAQAPGAAQASNAAHAEHHWRLADIRAGLPQIYAATREMFVAQMLNLDLVDGISFTKGCFTGQEIIARTQHLGRIKRRMFRLRLPAGAWALGQAVHLSDGRTGRLTDFAPVANEFEALAVLNIETGAAASGSPGAGTAETDGPATEVGEPGAATAKVIEADVLPLPYGWVQAS
jgi:folate-binding protein YgfZ